MDTPKTIFTAIRPHISIDVQDIRASILFYTALFGQEPVKVRPGYAKFSLQSPALNFSMNVRAHNNPGSLNHLGFEVRTTEEVLAAKDRLELSGIRVREELETTCCYAKQDKIWISDPDQNAWEIFTVTESDVPNARGEGEGACCVPNLDVVETAACCVPSGVQLETASCC